ncbi:hypothetical protein BX600DRAFT_77766 [Xylariales sp. PMI_506]|nr:hypothetical protein BX600DRAFT_77766 [Xylariales sp. PMI_506]
MYSRASLAQGMRIATGRCFLGVSTGAAICPLLLLPLLPLLVQLLTHMLAINSGARYDMGSQRRTTTHSLCNILQAGRSSPTIGARVWRALS